MPHRRLPRAKVSPGPECPQRAGPCAALNTVWLLDADGALERTYASCTCGTRFGVDGDRRDAWRRHLAAADRPGPDVWLSHEQLASAVAGSSEPGQRSAHAAPGVVGVGSTVIRTATDSVDSTDPLVVDLAAHMVAVMEAAPGVGLAANQVGAGVRVIALNFPATVPPVWVNPVMVASPGEWVFEEGCLSLEVEGSHAEVIRPKQITVVADLPGGGQVVVEADEMLARVVLHELDHLEGLAYVQRLTPEVRGPVDDALAAAGIDPALLPPRSHDPPSSRVARVRR